MWSTRALRCLGKWGILGLWLAAITSSTCSAGGPRFISGSQGYNKAGVVMAWYTPQPLYFTDPGDLNAFVTHTQADAMVAAAAGVWNVPTANLMLLQGGELAEHVSSANTYFNGSDIVFPSDVQASNYQSIQIAVVYDSDGSVTDTLLGSGASDPSGCLQNGVLEDVDAFGKTAVIEHAVIILNGRCVGSDPQTLTQMQYQLTRIFGRVLGLAWSQLNDSVFTGATQVTAAEEAWWPLMHPIDVRCGTYTYQCMQNAFTLRPDDLSALALLYPVTAANALPGKTPSITDAVDMQGTLNFPTGQGMDLVNVTVTRMLANVDHNQWEAYPIISSSTGVPFQQNGGNSVSGLEGAGLNAGADQTSSEGTFYLTRVPAGNLSVAFLYQTESINPLYYGDYAVGAYQRPPIALSGSPLSVAHYSITHGITFSQTLTATTAAANCTPGSDGTAKSPAAADPSGLWNGLLCAVGHTSWWSQSIKADRSWTIEMTAVNETGAPTPQKAQLVIGVWNMSDATGGLPTVASQAVAQNSMSLGMTQVQVPAAVADSSLRIAVADQFGGGRPDFAYNARILYADSLSPATLGASGGQITIHGTGFRQGNQVTINGVPATIVSWSANQIIATAPGKGVARAGSAAVDVAVIDPGTAGASVMYGALTYTGQAIDAITLVSAPASLETGSVAATPFAVRVYQADGVTPAAGANVSFVVTGSGGGGAVLMNCGSGTGCVATTDATGLVQQQVMGVSAGAVTVSATEMSGGASVQASVADADPVRTVTIAAASQYLAAGAAGKWSFFLTATQDGTPAAGVPVAWSTAAVGFTLAQPSATTAADGSSQVVVQTSSIAAGSANVVGGCAWSSVCATWTVYGIDPSQWMVTVANGGTQAVTVGNSLTAVTLQVTDTAGHILPGATVNIYQTAYEWEGPCPAAGPCASAPVLASTQSTAVSDANGQVQITPLQVPQVSQTLSIAASTGTQGFTSATLRVTP